MSASALVLASSVAERDWFIMVRFHDDDEAKRHRRERRRRRRLEKMEEEEEGNGGGGWIGDARAHDSPW